MNGRKARSRRSNHLTIITAIAVIAALYFGREILIPFAVALLLSLLLAPMVKRVERVGIGRVTSVILVTASSFCLVLAAGWLVVAQAQSVADNLPSYRKNIIEKTRAVRSSVRRVLGSASEAVEEIQHEIGRSETDASLSNAPQPPDPSLGDSAAGQAPTASGAIDANVEAASPEAVKVEVVAQNAGLAALTAALSSLVRPMAIAGIAFVFAIFMLIWREDLRDRVIRVFGSRRISFSTQAINDMGAAVSRYLLMLFFVNAVNGAVIALGLWLIGVPSALLWGLLMALLRFVPLIGTITAASLPILLALAIFDNWTYPLMVIALFIVVDAVSANFVEPVLYGTQIGASPMAVLAAATFWTWLWGPIGLLLAMPLTVSLVVLGRYVRPLSFLTVLLGNEPALPRELRFYQRLLSNDVSEAGTIISTAVRQGQSREEVYEQVVAPAVILAKEDRAAGVLDTAQAALVHDTLESVLKAAEARYQTENAAATARVRRELDGLRIDCVPAHGRFDELLCQMMCQLLAEDGRPCRVVSRRVLAGELVESLHAERADVLCIMAVGMDGETRARYLVKRLLEKHRDLPIVVGLWGTPDVGTAVARPWGGPVDVATSFAQARENLHRLSNQALAEARPRAESVMVPQ